MSFQIWISLRSKLDGKNIKNGRHWEDLVDFTIEELMSHVESQFTDGMNWDNRNKWHIDHIKPQSLFVFNSMDTKEFKECWSLENLQPLWAVEKIQKILEELECKENIK